MSLRQSIGRRIEPLRSDNTNYSARTGAVVVGLMAVALFVAIAQWRPIGGDSGQVVRAEFTAANQVSDFSPVRVAGVDVGKVQSVEPGSSPGTATVEMRITNEDVVVRRDARADVRWRTVLGGNMFIDLQPGSPSAPELGDAAIPTSRTTSQAELDHLVADLRSRHRRDAAGDAQGPAQHAGRPGRDRPHHRVDGPGARHGRARPGGAARARERRPAPAGPGHGAHDGRPRPRHGEAPGPRGRRRQHPRRHGRQAPRPRRAHRPRTSDAGLDAVDDAAPGHDARASRPARRAAARRSAEHRTGRQRRRSDAPAHAGAAARCAPAAEGGRPDADGAQAARARTACRC